MREELGECFGPDGTGIKEVWREDDEELLIIYHRIKVQKKKKK